MSAWLPFDHGAHERALVDLHQPLHEPVPVTGIAAREFPQKMLLESFGSQPLVQALSVLFIACLDRIEGTGDFQSFSDVASGIDAMSPTPEGGLAGGSDRHGDLFDSEMIGGAAGPSGLLPGNDLVLDGVVGVLRNDLLVDQIALRAIWAPLDDRLRTGRPDLRQRIELLFRGRVDVDQAA